MDQSEVLALIKRKLTSESGKQAKVVEDSAKLKKDGAAGQYDPKLDIIIADKKTPSNVLAHEAQHEIDVKQRRDAKQAGLAYPSKQGRGTEPHAAEGPELMSPVISPARVTDKQLAQEANENLRVRRETMDAKTAAWLDQNVPEVVQDLLGLKASRVEDVSKLPKVESKPPVSFQDALRQLNKKR